MINKKYLIFAFIIQLVLLAGMLINANIPHYLGKKIHLEVKPVDPRSLFRGNYVILQYDFSNVILDQNNAEDPQHLKRDDLVFVELKQEDSSYTFNKLHTTNPDNWPYLKCRLKSIYNKYSKKDENDKKWSARIHCGIEAWFCPKEKAKNLEKLRNLNKLKASIYVTDSGRAAIDNLIIEND